MTARQTHQHEDTMPPNPAPYAHAGLPPEQYRIDIEEMRRIAQDVVAIHDANQGNILERRLAQEKKKARYTMATVGLVTVVGSVVTTLITNRIVRGRTQRQQLTVNTAPEAGTRGR